MAYVMMMMMMMYVMIVLLLLLLGFVTDFFSSPRPSSWSHSVRLVSPWLRFRG